MSKQSKNSFTTSHQQAAVQPQPGKWLLGWDKQYCLWTFFLSLSFYCWAEHHMLWNILDAFFINLGQLSQLCLLLTILSLFTVGVDWGESLDAVQELFNNSAVLNTNAKHGTVCDAMKKMIITPSQADSVQKQRSSFQVTKIQLKYYQDIPSNKKKITICDWTHIYPTTTSPKLVHKFNETE